MMNSLNFVKDTLYDFENGTFEYFDLFIEYFEGLPTAFHDMLLDLHEEIDNQVNPLSDDNIDDWNSSVTTFKTRTIIGQLTGFVTNDADVLVSSLSGANPSAHLYVNTLGSSLGGAYIPATTIDIDMSWYGAYRTQCHNILRAFMLLGYFLLFIRALPSLLGGASPVVDFLSSVNSDIDNISSYENLYVNTNSGLVTQHETVVRDGSSTIHYRS